MASEWRTAVLGDLTVNHDGKRRPVKESERRSGPYPYYGASGIVDYVDDYLLHGEYLLIAEDGENLRSRQTPIAFMARGKSWVNNHAHIVTGNENADTKFLMYAIEGMDINGYLTGAVMPKLTQGNLNKIELVCPPLDEQRAIAHILGTLDDKIELNRRLNETLESMARALFKAWFVDFEPVRAKQEGRWRRGQSLPGLPAHLYDLFPDRLVESELGEIPEGWENNLLSSLACFQNGYAFKAKDWTDSGYPVVKIGNVKPGIIDLSGCSYVSKETVAKLEKFALRKGDLLVGMTGYVGETGLVPEFGTRAYLNQRVGRITTKRGISDLGYVFCVVRDPAYKIYAESKAYGSAQANVSGKDLMNYPVIKPGDQILHEFNMQISSFILLILENYAETRYISSLRDILLSKLISGKLRVPDVERGIETMI